MKTRISILLLCMSGLVWAEDVDVSMNELLSLPLEDLMNIKIYTASQEMEKAAKSAAITSVITHEQLRQWGVLNLYEALAFLPGIVKNETYMGYTVLTFRGVTPGLFNNKALFMINGHPAYENLFGSSHLEYVPIEMVERIEVVRSPASVLYGTQAISGVVNVITKRQARNRLGLRAGSHNHGMLTGSYFSEELSMGASLQRDDGYDYTGTMDEYGNPVNMDYQDDLQNLFVDWQREDLRVSAAYYKQEDARFGPNPWVWLNGINETESWYLDVNKAFDLGGGKLNLWLRLDNMDKKFHLGQFPYPADPAVCASYNIPTTPDYCALSNPLAVSDTTTDLLNTIKRQTFEVQYKNRLGDKASYIVGMAAENADTSPMSFVYLVDGSVNPNGGFAGDKDSVTTALYGQLKYSFSDDLEAVLGLRTEKNDDAGYSGAVPRLGLTYQVKPDVYLKALYSEAYRTPVFLEKYAYVPGFLFGKIDLEREKIKTAELGLDARLNQENSLQLALFKLRLENEILRWPSVSNPPATEYYNAAGRDMYGVEADWKSILTDRLEMMLNVSWLDGEDKTQKQLQPGTQSDAPFVANTTLNLVLAYNINSSWSCSLTHSYTGEKAYVLSPARGGLEGEIDAYSLTNLVVNFRRNKHELGMTIRNLFDEEYVYPEPVRRNLVAIPGGDGLSGYVSYRYSFD